MSFIKLGELNEIKLENLESCVSAIDPNVFENFRKFATNLKKIAPKADDFLYFVCPIIHAAESSAINDDGTPKLNLKGEEVKVGWDTSNGTWKWISNDPNIKAYKNSNGDIFPEVELIKAYKKWIHKPLCIDHKSSSVDHTRGFIVDTYYDRNLKRVIALCALDKANYPDLARKVSTRMQTAVSMGTGVSQAVCYDCGKVARVESDFCHHMRNKTCYGEINIGLNPIELSIVVNGADGKAHIKDIIASANTMNIYLENRAQELNKLAENTYSANIIVNDGSGSDSKSQQININTTNLDAFRSEIDDAFKKLQEFKDGAKNSDKDSNYLAFNQSSGSIAMDENTPSDSGLALQTPQNTRFAASSNDDLTSLVELQKVSVAIEATLNQMKKSLEKLSKTTSTEKQEEIMSGKQEINKEAYFQGGGGVNEPTPGQVKYPKDPLNEQLREHEDKQMVGQPPFPQVGPVDGMHPSPASVDPSNELERKKMLARAEVEDRNMKRNAIVNLAKETLKNKEAYWQGGGGVNEPTPGKAKYPKDKLNEELRDYEDKQMVGQPPFPGVGNVDGLHPSPASAEQKDELKRKQMLSRASLRARFVKAANQDGSQDRSKSAWEVFLGDKLILTASVQDLCGGHVSDVLYDNIATKNFGASLIEKVKSSGAEAVGNMIKKAQVPPPPPAEVNPPAPEATPEMVPAASSAPPPAEMAPPVEDAGKDGDPKDSVVEISDKIRDLSSDLSEAARALTGEQAEMGNMENMSADDVKKEAFSTSTFNSLRKSLNKDLTFAIKESLAELNNHQQELNYITDLYSKGSINDSNKDFTNSIVEDAINEAKTAVADGFKLMTAFVKYARGTKAIMKRAEMESELKSLASEGDLEMAHNVGDNLDNHDPESLMSLLEKENTHHDMEDLKLEKLLEDDMSPEDHEEKCEDEHEMEGSDNNDLTFEPGEKVPSELAGKKLTMASFANKNNRALLRAKLAADALGKEDDGEIEDMSKAKFSDMLEQADSLADGQTQLDVKPSGNLGRIETLPEKNKRMMEVAKMPPRVRKEAETIQRLVSEGKLSREDVNELESHGLDKDAVSYWKKYYGEVDGGSEFATELVKEHVKSEMAEELNTFKVKLARAYELTYEMADRGLCGSDRATISEQVDQIMKLNDAGFESVKKVVAMHKSGALRKEASVRLPNNGYVSQDEFVPKAAEVDEFSQLSSMFGNKKGVF